MDKLGMGVGECPECFLHEHMFGTKNTRTLPHMDSICAYIIYIYIYICVHMYSIYIYMYIYTVRSAYIYIYIYVYIPITANSYVSTCIAVNFRQNASQAALAYNSYPALVMLTILLHAQR